MILTATAGTPRGCEATLDSLYHSTRSSAQSVTGKFAIRTGIAPDGGLYVSDVIPEKRIDLDRICNQTFQETALEVLFQKAEGWPQAIIRNVTAHEQGYRVMDMNAIARFLPNGEVTTRA